MFQAALEHTMQPGLCFLIAGITDGVPPYLASQAIFTDTFYN
jgi:hypothetical protein